MLERKLRSGTFKTKKSRAGVVLPNQTIAKDEWEPTKIFPRTTLN